VLGRAAPCPQCISLLSTMPPSPWGPATWESAVRFTQVILKQNKEEEKKKEKSKQKEISRGTKVRQDLARVPVVGKFFLHWCALRGQRYGGRSSLLFQSSQPGPGEKRGEEKEGPPGLGSSLFPAST